MEQFKSQDGGGSITVTLTPQPSKREVEIAVADNFVERQRVRDKNPDIELTNALSLAAAINPVFLANQISD
jgi:hypothetical protein